MHIIFVIWPFDFFSWLLAQPLVCVSVCVCVYVHACAHVSRDRLENILSAKTNKHKNKTRATAPDLKFCWHFSSKQRRHLY